MDKDLITSNHIISITERKNINLTGVKKIDSFDNQEFLMDTIMGYIIIKGEVKINKNQKLFVCLFIVSSEDSYLILIIN